MDIEKKIKYQARRGLLELDLLLSDFVLQECSKLNEGEKKILLDFLTMDDMVLWDILQKKQQPDEEYKNIIGRIEVFNRKVKL